MSARRLRILVVEDEEEIRELLVAGLTHFGHEVSGAVDFRSAEAAFQENAADVVVVDLGLPDGDGLELIARFRAATSCGIVVVTARGSIEERLRGLRSGADLYFIKPVDIRELAAALENLGRRLHPERSRAWGFDATRSVLRTPGGVEVPLTGQESTILRLLFARPGETVSRSSLFESLGYPADRYADLRLEALVSRLRGKVRTADPGSELPLKARHGSGYAFLAEGEW